MIVDKRSVSFNAEEIAQKLIDGFANRSKVYLHDEMFIQWGGDFRFMDAFQNFQQLDRVIEYMNEYHSDEYHVKYSTPSEYIDAVKQYNISWPTKYDDLFPYSAPPANFWTGYFTSRANQKGYIRSGSHITHASNQLYAIKALN